MLAGKVVGTDGKKFAPIAQTVMSAFVGALALCPYTHVVILSYPVCGL